MGAFVTVLAQRSRFYLLVGDVEVEGMLENAMSVLIQRCKYFNIYIQKVK
jgi:hypothetical protein